MTSVDLHKLLRYVADNRLKEAYEIIESMTMQERDVLAKALFEGAKVLMKTNEEWRKALNYPAKNEE